MSDTDRTREDPFGLLFDQLGDVTAGMLGVVDSGQHMQPMTHFPDREAGAIWFITARDTDLVRAVGQGATAHYCVVGKKHDFHACLSGPLTAEHNPEKLDELWNAVTAAWFEGGRDDSQVVLLKLALNEAALWSSSDSSVVFGLEILRGNLSAEHKPDLGEHVVVRFPEAA
jgi:general stress protein 26